MSNSMFEMQGTWTPDSIINQSLVERVVGKRILEQQVYMHENGNAEDPVWSQVASDANVITIELDLNGYTEMLLTDGPTLEPYNYRFIGARGKLFSDQQNFSVRFNPVCNWVTVSKRTYTQPDNHSGVYLNPWFDDDEYEVKFNIDTDGKFTACNFKQSNSDDGKAHSQTIDLREAVTSNTNYQNWSFEMNDVNLSKTNHTLTTDGVAGYNFMFNAWNSYYTQNYLKQNLVKEVEYYMEPTSTTDEFGKESKFSHLCKYMLSTNHSNPMSSSETYNPIITSNNEEEFKKNDLLDVINYLRGEVKELGDQIVDTDVDFNQKNVVYEDIKSNIDSNYNNIEVLASAYKKWKETAINETDSIGLEGRITLSALDKSITTLSDTTSNIDALKKTLKEISDGLETEKKEKEEVEGKISDIDLSLNLLGDDDSEAKENLKAEKAQLTAHLTQLDQSILNSQVTGSQFADTIESVDAVFAAEKLARKNNIESLNNNIDGLKEFAVMLGGSASLDKFIPISDADLNNDLSLVEWVKKSIFTKDDSDINQDRPYVLTDSCDKLVTDKLNENNVRFSIIDNTLSFGVDPANPIAALPIFNDVGTFNPFDSIRDSISGVVVILPETTGETILIKSNDLTMYLNNEITIENYCTRSKITYISENAQNDYEIKVDRVNTDFTPIKNETRVISITNSMETLSDLLVSDYLEEGVKPLAKFKSTDKLAMIAKIQSTYHENKRQLEGDLKDLNLTWSDLQTLIKLFDVVDFKNIWTNGFEMVLNDVKDIDIDCLDVNNDKQVAIKLEEVRLCIKHKPSGDDITIDSILASGLKKLLVQNNNDKDTITYDKLSDENEFKYISCVSPLFDMNDDSVYGAVGTMLKFTDDLDDDNVVVITVVACSKFGMARNIVFSADGVGDLSDMTHVEVVGVENTKEKVMSESDMTKRSIKSKIIINSNNVFNNNMFDNLNASKAIKFEFDYEKTVKNSNHQNIIVAAEDGENYNLYFSDAFNYSVDGEAATTTLDSKEVNDILFGDSDATPMLDNRASIKCMMAVHPMIRFRAHLIKFIQKTEDTTYQGNLIYEKNVDPVNFIAVQYKYIRDEVLLMQPV